MARLKFANGKSNWRIRRTWLVVARNRNEMAVSFKKVLINPKVSDSSSRSLNSGGSSKFDDRTRLSMNRIRSDSETWCPDELLSKDRSEKRFQQIANTLNNCFECLQIKNILGGRMLSVAKVRPIRLARLTFVRIVLVV